MSLPVGAVCNARRVRSAAGVVLLGCVTAISAGAQQQAALTRVVAKPVIKSLKISGNANIGDSELKAAMETVPSGCKGVPVLGVWMSLVALRYASNIAVASTILAISPIFVIPLVRVVHGTPITMRAVVGSLVAVGGRRKMGLKVAAKSA